METHPLTAKNWLIVALIALAFGLWFVAPYIGVIALAALMAFLFHGIYEWFGRKMKSGLAATLTFLSSVLIILIPVAIVGVFTAFQLGTLARDVTNAVGGDVNSLPGFVQTVIAHINSAASPITGEGQLITNQGVLEFIKTTVPNVLRSLTTILTGFAGSIPVGIILTIMYIFLFFEFLVYGKKIIKSIVALSPFQPEVTRMYLSRVGMMANAMAKGQLVIAVILAVLEALAIVFFFNFWDYFFLLAVAFTVLNLIPLGAGILAYPIIFITMLTGQVWPGVGALIAVTIVSNLEAFLRPRFIPKSITLTNGLTMLAAFGGIALWGLLGVVYGPILMIIIVTSIQMYLDYYQDVSDKKKPGRSAKSA